MTEHTLGVIADPGVPIRMARAVLSDLMEELSEETGEQWDVDLSQHRLPLDAEGNIPLAEHASRLREEHSWEYLVYLTDLPLVHSGEALLCEVSAEDQAALISVPSLGVWRSTARLRRLITALVNAASGVADYPSEAAMKRIVGHRRVQRDFPQLDTRSGGERDDADTWVFVQLLGGRNRLELLAGMVKSNRPLGLVTALSTAFSLAAATGAFGIFYGSVWTLADSLHPARQLLISVAVITLLSTWLIVRNGLWSWGRETNVRWQRRLDNAATVLTIGLGSNFNSEESIREATYSRRVYERRRMADSFDERGATE